MPQRAPIALLLLLPVTTACRDAAARDRATTDASVVAPCTAADTAFRERDDFGPIPDAVVEVKCSADGRWRLVRVWGRDPDDPTMPAERVALVAGSDSMPVFSWTRLRPIGLAWAGPTLGEVWLAVGGNWHHASLFVHAPTRRVTRLIEDPVAVDGEAGTVVTWDIDRFTLRALWSEDSLGTWVPRGRTAQSLWEDCDPAFTLTGRAARVRYECPDRDPVEQAIVWRRVATVRPLPTARAKGGASR